jgi:hypothetical protein
MSRLARKPIALRSRAAHRTLAAALLLAAASPGLLSAQVRPGEPVRGGEPLSRSRDFLLQTPAASVSLRGGMNFARAGGDVFEFVRETLTVDRSDFDAVSAAADVAVRLHPRLDLVGSVGYSRAAAQSDDRENFEDLDGDGAQDPGEEILQDNRLTQLPITVSLRAYLSPRGRSVGQLAWVPARFAPYVGVGGGLVWHRFEQEGDFVDRSDLSIFTARLHSGGWAPTAHALAGAEYSLSPRFALVGEARYSWASGEPDDADFEGFDSVDLSGLQTTVGFSVRF